MHIRDIHASQMMNFCEFYSLYKVLNITVR